MSIVDQEGQPVAHGWNDEAVTERCRRDEKLRLLPDEEFEKRFPELFPRRDPPVQKATQ